MFGAIARSAANKSDVTNTAPRDASIVLFNIINISTGTIPYYSVIGTAHYRYSVATLPVKLMWDYHSLMFTIQVVLKDYTLILAYKLLMTFMLRQNTLCRQLSYRLGISLGDASQLVPVGQWSG
jgi:hypothetical protein